MMIARECFRDGEIAHDNKGDTIRLRPSFVSVAVIVGEASIEKDQAYP
jgi:hypothetical protein